jgi:hypothetical protein
LSFYWSFSAQSNFRFWIGLGLGSDVMLLIFNILVIVFRCKPITASFRPMERLTAQCMDSGFALFAPAALVCSERQIYYTTRLTSGAELLAKPLRLGIAHIHLLFRPGTSSSQDAHLLHVRRWWRCCCAGLHPHALPKSHQLRHRHVKSSRRDDDRGCTRHESRSGRPQPALTTSVLEAPLEVSSESQGHVAVAPQQQTSKTTFNIIAGYRWHCV